MRLLVTGAAGFLGRNVLLTVPRSWQVVALYRPGNVAFLQFVSQHELRNVQPVACDVTDIHQVQHIMADCGNVFDSCLALASNTSIPLSIEQPAQDLSINTLGLLTILETCVFDHVVFLSTGTVYDGLTGRVGPTSAVFPVLPYAISKLTSEQYIRAFVRYRQTLKHATIIRFFGAYGPYEPERKLYTKLVRQFAFERNPCFTVTGDGEDYIDAMYVDDACQALMAVLQTSPEERICCIDLGAGRGERVNQVVTRAAHLFGVEPQIQHIGTPASYIQFCIDARPFAHRYNFSTTIPLEVGLKRLAAHLESGV